MRLSRDCGNLFAQKMQINLPVDRGGFRVHVGVVRDTHTHTNAVHARAHGCCPDLANYTNPLFSGELPNFSIIR